MNSFRHVAVLAAAAVSAPVFGQTTGPDCHARFDASAARLQIPCITMLPAGATGDTYAPLRRNPSVSAALVDKGQGIFEMTEASERRLEKADIRDVRVITSTYYPVVLMDVVLPNACYRTTPVVEFSVTGTTVDMQVSVIPTNEGTTWPPRSCVPAPHVLVLPYAINDNHPFGRSGDYVLNVNGVSRRFNYNCHCYWPE